MSVYELAYGDVYDLTVPGDLTVALTIQERCAVTVTERCAVTVMEHTALAVREQ